LRGAFAPYISIYGMVLASISGLCIPAQKAFGALYFSDACQQAFAVDNSFIAWGVALWRAVWRGAHVFIAFIAAAHLPLALDVPLHTKCARQHLWPTHQLGV